MIEVYALTAVALITAGAVLGFMAVVSLGIRRDDRRNGLRANVNGRRSGFLANTDDRIARGARRVTRAGARGMTISTP